jgi:quinol monooxygenase YgiN
MPGIDRAIARVLLGDQLTVSSGIAKPCLPVIDSRPLDKPATQIPVSCRQHQRKFAMSNLDRRTFLGTAAAGGALAALLSGVAESAEKDKKGGYYVIAEIIAKPGKEDELRDLLVPFAKSARKEPGCQTYTLLEVQSEPGRFLTFERWANKAALDVHMTTPEIQAIVPKLEPVLAKPFSQLFLDARAGA